MFLFCIQYYIKYRVSIKLIKLFYNLLMPGYAIHFILRIDKSTINYILN